MLSCKTRNVCGVHVLYDFLHTNPEVVNEHGIRGLAGRYVGPYEIARGSGGEVR
jgi:hypothetical protein